MFLKSLIAFLVFLNFFLDAYANEKQSIITHLSEIKNFSFNFKQVTKEKVEIGNCLIEFDKKLKCSYDDKLQKEIIINSKTLVILQKRYNKYILIKNLIAFIKIFYWNKTKQKWKQ